MTYTIKDSIKGYFLFFIREILVLHLLSLTVSAIMFFRPNSLYEFCSIALRYPVCLFIIHMCRVMSTSHPEFRYASEVDDYFATWKPVFRLKKNPMLRHIPGILAFLTWEVPLYEGCITYPEALETLFGFLTDNTTTLTLFAALPGTMWLPALFVSIANTTESAATSSAVFMLVAVFAGIVLVIACIMAAIANYDYYLSWYPDAFKQVAFNGGKRNADH